MSDVCLYVGVCVPKIKKSFGILDELLLLFHRQHIDHHEPRRYDLFVFNVFIVSVTYVGKKSRATFESWYVCEHLKRRLFNVLRFNRAWVYWTFISRTSQSRTE